MTEVKGGRGPAARRAVVERRPVGVRRERGIDLGTEPRAAPWAGTATVGEPMGDPGVDVTGARCGGRRGRQVGPRSDPGRAWGHVRGRASRRGASPGVTGAEAGAEPRADRDGLPRRRAVTRGAATPGVAMDRIVASRLGTAAVTRPVPPRSVSGPTRGPHRRPSTRAGLSRHGATPAGVGPGQDPTGVDDR